MAAFRQKWRMSIVFPPAFVEWFLLDENLLRVDFIRLAENSSVCPFIEPTKPFLNLAKKREQIPVVESVSKAEAMVVIEMIGMATRREPADIR